MRRYHPWLVKVLFVCLGNICRSPMAEGFLRRDAEAAGVQVEIDSAGTGNWHVGDPPDSRARETAIARGCQMNMRGRQVRAYDFEEFDLIVAMDRQNHRDLLRWPGADPTKVRLASTFDPGGPTDVGDPYYGGADGFEDVADQLERISLGILETVKEMGVET